MKRRATWPQLCAVVAVALPLLAWLLLTVRPVDGRVTRFEDFLLLIAKDGWQSFTLAVAVGAGRVFAAVVGTMYGVRATARPRQAGELTYLAAAGDGPYRRVVLRRGVVGLARTLGWIGLLTATSAVVGLVAFGSGDFESLDGSVISDREVVLLVIHGCLATFCIGAGAFIVTAALGIRASVQASAAAGVCGLFVEAALGGMPIIGETLRLFPFGNYNGWVNGLASDVSRGSTFALYMTTAIWTAVGLAVMTTRRFAGLTSAGGS